MARPERMLALLAVYGFVVSLAVAWIPGYWGDEGASVTMARKPFDDFLTTLGDVDAVHGTYYLALRGWGSLVGFSEGGTRSLSALAVGATCAVVVLLGVRLTDRATAVAAALLYPWLPAAFEQATQARSYALTALLTALFVLACTRAWDQPRSWGRWAVVGGVLVISTLGLPQLVARCTAGARRPPSRDLATGTGTRGGDDRGGMRARVTGRRPGHDPARADRLDPAPGA